MLPSVRVSVIPLAVERLLGCLASSSLANVSGSKTKSAASEISTTLKDAACPSENALRPTDKFSAVSFKVTTPVLRGSAPIRGSIRA